VGEIGIPRREFLYEVSYWEVLRIIKGYRRRSLYRNQLIATAAYGALFAMGNPERKKPADIFPEIFNTEDDDDYPDTPSVTEDDIAELKAEMKAMNDLQRQLAEQENAQDP
jgi:hypothetical protein